MAGHRDAYANGAKRRAFREACLADHQASSEVRSVLCYSPVVASNPGSGSRLSPVVDSTFEQSEEVAIIFIHCELLLA